MDFAYDIDEQAVYSYADNMRFRAGSYSGYNAWRNELAKLAGYPEIEYESWGRTEKGFDGGAFKASSGPFLELIKFSDCEGVIGTAVSKKLSKDFADFDQKAAEIGGLFYELYTEWKQAFEMASDGGFVNFN